MLSSRSLALPSVELGVGHIYTYHRSRTDRWPGLGQPHVTRADLEPSANTPMWPRVYDSRAMGYRACWGSVSLYYLAGNLPGRVLWQFMEGLFIFMLLLFLLLQVLVLLATTTATTSTAAATAAASAATAAVSSSSSSNTTTTTTTTTTTNTKTATIVASEIYLIKQDKII